MQHHIPTLTLSNKAMKISNLAYVVYINPYFQTDHNQINAVVIGSI